MDARMGLLVAILRRVQHELFNLGSILATLPQDVHPKQARITSIEVEQLEREIDAMNEDVPPLRSFVLPGGTRLNAELHIARTVCRRAERLLVALSRQESVPAEAIQYLNRLSDATFVWSRWANFVLHMPEVLWMFQMGVIYFWVTDDSRGQQRTARLLNLGASIVATLLRIAGLPLTRPLRKVAIELIDTVKGT